MTRTDGSQSVQPLLRAAAVAAPLALLALTGCDLPSELPKWDTTWVVPVEGTEISIAEMLPSGVTITADESAFAVEIDPVTVSKSFGEMCPPCAQFNGPVVPKPEFTTTLEATTALPNAVESVTPAASQLQVQLHHDFSFDPIRPSSSARGYVVVTISSGSTELAKDSISGNDTAFGPGTTLTRTLEITPVAVTDDLTLAVRIYSPAGDPVVVNSGASFTATMPPWELLASEARVQLTTQTITIEESELDLEDVDTDVSDHVKRGALRLTIDNPFEITGNLSLTITAPGGVHIVKSLQIVAGQSDQRLELNRQELDSILGQPGVMVSGSGSLSSASGGTTVTPSSSIDISTRFEVTVGGVEEG